jgi:hypothetical protein
MTKASAAESTTRYVGSGHGDHVEDLCPLALLYSWFG